MSLEGENVRSQPLSFRLVVGAIHQVTQVISTPLQPRFSTLQRLAFPQTKITFEREEISDLRWDSGKHDRAADNNSNKGFCSVLNSGRDAGRTVWGPKVPTLKGTEASLSYIQCFLYLVSSSINAFIFHSTWMVTFWTGLVLFTFVLPSLVLVFPNVQMYVYTLLWRFKWA